MLYCINQSFSMCIFVFLYSICNTVYKTFRFASIVSIYPSYLRSRSFSLGDCNLVIIVLAMVPCEGSLEIVLLCQWFKCFNGSSHTLPNNVLACDALSRIQARAVFISPGRQVFLSALTGTSFHLWNVSTQLVTSFLSVLPLGVTYLPKIKTIVDSFIGKFFYM